MPNENENIQENSEQAAAQEQKNQPEQNNQPKEEKKKKNKMPMPGGPGGLRLEHEYQVLFGDNGSEADAAPRAPQAAAPSRAQNDTKSGGGSTDERVQRLEAELAQMRAAMQRMQAEIQQLKAGKAPVQKSEKLENQPTILGKNGMIPNDGTSVLEGAMLSHLRQLNGNKDIPQKVKDNIHQIMQNGEKSDADLWKVVHEKKEGEPIYAGGMVQDIVAKNGLVDYVFASKSTDVMEQLGQDDFPAQWKKMTTLSPNVRFASDYLHDKAFFTKYIFTRAGAEELPMSMDKGLKKWDEYIKANKDPEQLFMASKIESEKMAIKAGLIKPANAVSNEEKLLTHLQKINGGKEVSPKIKENLHQVLTEAKTSRQLLKQAMDGQKDGESIYAGKLVPAIVAGRNISDFIMGSSGEEI
ncbi:MAG: hypothetical protein KBS74_01810, partial [Clostridiales bacterium]|nr:hypothetical protein [Candidatus Cacconaster stercorequi]